jgi:excisionase family DNA binding protein
MPSTKTTTAVLDKDRLLKPAEAADYLAVSPKTLWLETAPRGRLPAVRIRGLVRYRVLDLDAYIAASTNGAATPAA